MSVSIQRFSTRRLPSRLLWTNRVSLSGSARLVSSTSSNNGSDGFNFRAPQHISVVRNLAARNGYSTALAIGRPTRVLLIPPQLARLLAAAGLVMLDAFYVAYQKEAKRLREEEGSGSGSGEKSGGGGGSAEPVPMRGEEALRVLGMDPSMSVPLKKQKDIDEATKKFNSLFLTAQKCDNVYLQGKFSAAFRVCVDPNWDAHLSSDSESGAAPTSHDGSKTSSSSSSS